MNDELYKSSNIVAIIPARGGSKGLPDKNIKDLLGLPLIAHSILDAKESRYISDIFVSTDSAKIAEVSISYGAKVIERPENLATDTATSEAALIHALDYIETTGCCVDLVVFLQCTSPVRTGKDIDLSIQTIYEANADSLVSVSPSHRFLWQEKDGKVVPINYDYRYRPRRQDMPPQYVENGSIYVFKPWVLRNLNNRLGGKVCIMVMSEEAACEIDNLVDFHIAETLLKNYGGRAHVY